MPDNRSQHGLRPEKTGRHLELFIAERLLAHEYEEVSRQTIDCREYCTKPIFARQFPFKKGIYGTEVKVDFLLYHPEKHPSCLIIEAKWQQTGGSVDEKFPYLYLNLIEFPYPSILVLDGGGYRAGAEKWIRSRTRLSNKFNHVFSMSEFQIWANNGNL